MHKLIILIFFTLLSLPIKAQTLHAIIFANTECPGDPRNPNDPGIGPSVSGDYYRMKIEMTTIAAFIDYELKTHYYIGDQEQFSRESLEKVLKGLKCDPQDIVFFYYSGHGSRSKNEKTDFPQMNFVVDPYKSRIPESTANYPLYNVMTRIKEKSPRLTIVLGDMCNSVANWVTPKTLPFDKAATKVEDAPVKFYKDLFLNVKGSLIATSSKPGQTSAAYSDGGAFTLGFMESLQQMVSEGMEPSWKNLLDYSVAATESRTQCRQTPIYDVSDLHIATSDTNTQIEPTTQTDNTAEITSTPDITEDEVAISNLLTSVGSESVDEEKRIELAIEAMSLLFDSPNAVIKVVGRDGKTEVSTKTAKAYLDWLTVTTNLYKVVPIQAQISGNKKFTYLQVHEMYK